jgi:hypothetical protein
MTKASIDLQDLRRRIYVKAKAEPSWRFWGVNAGEKMYQRAGVKLHHGWSQMPHGTAFAARQTE